MKKGFLKSVSDSAKIKYTSAGVIFTALVIAIVILANSIISVLAENHKFYFDMTDEQVYTMSDALKNVMDSTFESTNAQVEIIFPYEKSEADSTTALAYIHSTAKLLEQKYGDNISVSYHDIKKEPNFYRELIKNGNPDDTPTRSTIVLAKKNSDGEFTGEYYIHNMSTFFSTSITDGSIYGYDGEYVFASSIIRLTLEEHPVVYFTIRHNEDIKIDDDGNITDKSGIVKIFEDIGFTAKALDTTQIDQIPDDARSVIIYNPTSDFTDKEMNMITTFFQSEHGHVMCFTPYDKNLPVLYGHIESVTGITVVAGDKLEGDSSSIVRPNVPSNDATNSYFSSLLSSTASKPIIKNAGYLTIKERFAEGDYYFGSNIQTSPLLTLNSSTMLNADKEERILMAISASERLIDQTSSLYSYMIVCPSDGFATDDYLYDESNVYPNRDFLLALLHSTTGYQVPFDLDTKAFYEYKIDITEKQASYTTVIMAVLIPAVITVCGVVVITRRKRR